MQLAFSRPKARTQTTRQPQVEGRSPLVHGPSRQSVVRLEILVETSIQLETDRVVGVILRVPLAPTQCVGLEAIRGIDLAQEDPDLTHTQDPGPEGEGIGRDLILTDVIGRDLEVEDLGDQDLKAEDLGDRGLGVEELGEDLDLIVTEGKDVRIPETVNTVETLIVGIRKKIQEL